MQKESSEIVTATAQGLSPLDPKELQTQLDLETERRKVIKTFIKKQLKEGVDFGKIHVVAREKCPNYYNCKNPYHFSKPCLFKAGSEKFASLLQLHAEFSADEETMKMAGKTEGTFFLKCLLIHNRSGAVIAEGRGACSIKEKGGNANNALKICQKRAQIDATLRLGLSDVFTQDLEDMNQEEKTEEIPNNLETQIMLAIEQAKTPELAEQIGNRANESKKLTKKFKEKVAKKVTEKKTAYVKEKPANAV